MRSSVGSRLHAGSTSGNSTAHVQPTDIPPTDIPPTVAQPTDARPTDARPHVPRPTTILPTHDLPKLDPRTTAGLTHAGPKRAGLMRSTHARWAHACGRQTHARWSLGRRAHQAHKKNTERMRALRIVDTTVATTMEGDCEGHDGGRRDIGGLDGDGSGENRGGTVKTSETQPAV